MDVPDTVPTTTVPRLLFPLSLYTTTTLFKLLSKADYMYIHSSVFQTTGDAKLIELSEGSTVPTIDVPSSPFPLKEKTTLLELLSNVAELYATAAVV